MTNEKLTGKMWKECGHRFMQISDHIPGGTLGNQEKPQYNRHFNPGPSEYEVEEIRGRL